MSVCLPIAPELQLFYLKLKSQEGFPYTWPTETNRWSGKGLPNSLYPNGRDCSGTVTWPLFEAGYQPDLRAIANTKWMWANWKLAKNPLPGDFVLYANTKTGIVEHVMTYMEDGRVFGADGAGSNCQDPVTAAKLGAKVQWRWGIHYRGKVMGFVTNPLRRSAS